MPESRRHFRKRAGIAEVLGDFFERAGRCYYLTSELAVSLRVAELVARLGDTGG